MTGTGSTLSGTTKTGEPNSPSREHEGSSMLARIALISLALSSVELALHSNQAGAQEAPIFALSSVSVVGIPVGDICYDSFADRVYIVDLLSGETSIFTRTLQPLGVLPSAFPAGSLATGITADAATGTVFWLVVDSTSNTLQLWSAPDINVAPTLVGPVATTPGAFPAGLDAPNGIGNTLIFSDVINSSIVTINFAGVETRPPLLNPFGASFGIAHAQGPWLTLSADTLASGAPTHFLTSHGITGNPIDAVGIAIPPGLQILSFDYGRITPTGTRSMYVWEGSGTLSQFAVQRSFVRGDVNNDRNLDIADVVALTNWLFGAGPAATCEDAADANDDGTPNIADAVFLMNAVMGIVAISQPFPDCGYDSTVDALRCNAGFPGCP